MVREDGVHIMSGSGDIYLTVSGVIPKDVTILLVEDSQIKSPVEIKELLKALEDVTELYCNLVRSGDAGTWDADTEPEISNAKELLLKHNSIK